MTNAINFVLSHEGGILIDHSTGEVSNFGITSPFFQRFSPMAYRSLSVLKITRDIAFTTYANYLQYLQLDKLSTNIEGIQAKVFDMCVNMGEAHAVNLFQTVLVGCGAQIKVDGKIGLETINACNLLCRAVAVVTSGKTITFEDQILQDLVTKSESYYRLVANSDPNKAKYLDGWLARAKSLSIGENDANS